MPRFEHKKSRRLHVYRHGWAHYKQHRDGIKHAHRRKKRRRPTGAPTHHLRNGLLIGAAAALVLLAFLAAAAYRTLLNARTDLLRAENAATIIGHSTKDLTSQRGRQILAANLSLMKGEASQANRAVQDSLSLKVLSIVPLVGDQVDGVTSLVGDLHTASSQADGLLRQVNLTAKDSRPTAISMPDLTALSSEVDQAVAALRPLDRPSSGLWGPVASARATFNKDISTLTGLLSNGGRALHYALPFLGASGSRSYFLAAENNSEMRDQGAVLSWALLNATNGSYDVSGASSVGKLALSAPAPFPLPPGTQLVFGPLQPTQVWQSTNATADFPLSGADMATMYSTARPGSHVDGVIGIDVIAVRDLLKLTGPVKVDSIPKPVTASNLVPLVLHELYLSYPAGDQQRVRQDDLASIAQAVVDKLKHSHVDVGALIKTLANATQQRHLLLWDSNPSYESTVASFGASGSVSSKSPTSTFHLAVESAVAAKVDYFIHPAVAYKVHVLASGQADVSMTVTLKNSAPKNAKPSYALGPDHVNSTIPGEYVARIDFWSPLASIVAGGVPESGLVLNPSSMTVLPGSSSSLTFQVVLPHAVIHHQLRLRFVPQSSLWPQSTTVSVSGQGVSVGGAATTHFLALTPKTLSFPIGH